MIDFVNKFFRQRPDRPQPTIPPGQRVYAIGDIHGRADLFNAMVRAIEKDIRSREAADTTVILLGDLIDRGPESARVIKLARRWTQRRNVRFLSGNHEEMFLQSFFKSGTLRSFMRFGGLETLTSYGIPEEELLKSTPDQAQQMMIDSVPWEDREFLRRFELIISIGDYVFVHAGIRPKRAVKSQAPYDCRWIREPFLSFEGDHGYTVVHGHTVSDEPVVRHNRIGIDTGAFATGRLTALCLEGTDQILIEAAKSGKRIRTVARSASTVRENVEKADKRKEVPGSL